MPKLLTKLKINEVSTVDRGAGEGVSIKMQKRQDKIDEYMKREFTTEQRRQMASTGQAMDDGGYPIANNKDLKNAIRAIGQAKKPGKTKAHIISRARALGATYMLPDKWVRKSIEKTLSHVVKIMKSEGGEDFNTEFTEMQSLQFGEGLQEAVHDACHALKHSIDSIMEDDGTDNKGDAIRESFGQFLDHMKTLVPEGNISKQELLMGKAISFKKAYTSVGASDNKSRSAEISANASKPAKVVSMDADEKVIEGTDSEEETSGKAKAKAKRWQGRFNALVKMAKADKPSKDYMDHPDNDMDEDDVKKFIDMSSADRAKYIEENPIGTLTQKRVDALPEPVRKALEEGKSAAAALAKREEAETLIAMNKRVQDLHLPAAAEIAPHFVALHKAQPEAFDAVLKAFDEFQKSIKAQADTSVIFKEFGTKQGADATGTAYEQLTQKANVYREDMTKVGKSITSEQAFAKVYEDPINRDLVAMSKREGSIAA